MEYRDDVVGVSNEPAEVIEPVEPVEAVEPETTEQPDVETEQAETKKHDAQARIRKLANDTAALRRENEELRAKLSPTETQAQPAPAVIATGKPSPDDYVGGIFNTDYTDALVDFKIEQLELARESKNANNAIIKTVEQRENAFRADNAV